MWQWDIPVKKSAPPSSGWQSSLYPPLLATPYLVARNQSVPSDKIVNKVIVGEKALRGLIYRFSQGYM